MTAQGRVAPPLRTAFLVWGLAAALYFLAFFQRVTPAVITRELMTEFAIGAAALGKIADLTSIDTVYQVCAFLPLFGLLIALLPKIESNRLA